jgi:hypothetical protein
VVSAEETIAEEQVKDYIPGEIIELVKDGKARVREDGSLECAYCDGISASGEGFKNEQAVLMHWTRWCVNNPAAATVQMNAANSARKAKGDPDGVNIRSKRGRGRLNLDRAPDTMEEVARRPGGARGGPAAYFIRPGATISEALIVSPNGAPMIRNGSDRANSEYVQARMRKKGFEYVGPNLTEKGVRRLAEVIQENRPDFVLFLDEEIEFAERTINESDHPDVREQARTRRGQLMRQREFYARPLNVDAMIRALKDIEKAQKLAALTPEQREAMLVMMDEAISANVANLMQRMGHSTASSGDGFSVEITNADPSDDF